MSESIHPAPGMGHDRRGRDRRNDERRQGRAAPAGDASSPSAGLPALIPGMKAGAPTPPAPAGAAVFSAQLLGQSGQKRGLKGGPIALDEARSAYLGAEYSGPADRRPNAGRIRKTDI